MGKLRVGNKQNSFLNGQWAGHVRADGKKITSGIRREVAKEVIREAILEESVCAYCENSLGLGPIILRCGSFVENFTCCGNPAIISNNCDKCSNIII